MYVGLVAATLQHCSIEPLNALRYKQSKLRYSHKRISSLSLSDIY